MTAGASSFSSRAVALVCCGVAASLTIYASQALLGMLVEEFGVTGGNATLSISATTLGIALFSPFAGLISDRFGRKRVIVAASLLMLIPTLGAAFCSSFEAFILWRFMQGVLVPCIFSASSAYVGDEFKARELPAAIGIYAAGTTVGAVLSRILPAYCAAHWGRAGAFIGQGVTMAILVLLIIYLLPREQKKAVDAPLPLWQRLVRLFRNQRAVFVFIVGAGLLFSQVLMFSAVALLLSEAPFSLGVGTIGFIYLVFLPNIILVPLCSRFVPRISHRRVTVTGIGISILGAGLALVPSLPVLILGLSIFSSGVFVGQAMANSYLNGIVSQDRALAIGIYLSSYYLGGTLGGWLAGVAWTRFHWLGVVVTAMISMVTIGFIAFRKWHPIHIT